MVHSNNFLIVALCVAACFVEYGCKDSGTDPNDAPYFHGQVLDEQGNPVEGVGVHYMFDLVPSELSKGNSTMPSTTIRYELPHPAHVTLTILRWYSRELVATLVDTQQNAGIYQVAFDFSHVTNGVYLYRLLIDTAVTEKRMVLMNSIVAELVQTLPLATTDTQGRVAIAMGQFGFGVPFVRTSITGNILDTSYISSAIQMVLHKEGYRTLVQPLSIDPSREMSVSFTLRR